MTIQESGRFAQLALRYVEAGLAAYPADFEKKPVIGAGAARIRLPAARRLATDPRHANRDCIGLWCGPRNNLTVIDLDTTDAKWKAWALKRFGDTPIIVRTPSGGWHLWYRHDGERRLTKRRFLGDEYPIDLLGSGNVIAPGSMLLDGREYVFERGSLADVARLPTIPKAVIADLVRQINPPAALTVTGDRLTPGNRSDGLLREVLRLASLSATPEELLARAHAANAAMCDPPLTNGEISRMAAKVWSYKMKGDLRLPGCEPFIKVTLRSAKELYQRYPNPGTQYLYLRANHETKLPGEGFAVSGKAMAPALGLDPRQIYKHTNQLVADGFLEITAAEMKAAKPEERKARQFKFNQAKLAESRGTAPLFAAEDLPVKLPPKYGEGLIPLSDWRDWNSGPMPESVRQLVEYTRRRMGMTQQELADLIGVSRPQLANAGQGRFGLSEPVASKLKQFLMTAA